MEENTREWLTAYLRRRAQLASQACEFQCDPACSRPGCKSPDLQVPVSLVDLLGVARHQEESVSAIYRRHYVLGLFYNDTDYCFRTVSLKLKKPCPFLADDLCGIYPVRPLPCILFPEYLVSRGTFEEQAIKEQFLDYLCLQQPLELSSERTRVMATLRKMWEQESLVSSFYLFDHGHCHLDFTNLIEELPQGAKISRDAASGGNPDSLTHRVLEDFFQAHIASLQPFARVAERIAVLDTPEGQTQLLKSLQDKVLSQKLRQNSNDRALVFRFTNGQIKPQRRSILPSEYKFYA